MGKLFGSYLNWSMGLIVFFTYIFIVSDLSLIEIKSILKGISINRSIYKPSLIKANTDLH
jgi:hypothetical protein